MTGQLHRNRAIGSTNEAFCEAMLGRFASMIYVPNDQDFGIDFYCLPRIPVGKVTEAPVGLCGIQVKPQSTSVISFGGIADNGTWARHQLDWLRCLRMPLYLAIVDASYAHVDVYSLSRCVQVFWKTPFPYRIDCTIGAAATTTMTVTADPVPSSPSDGISFGDSQVWAVNLGAPLLRLSFAELDNDSVRESRRDVLCRWMEADRTSQENLVAGAPVVHIPQHYQTNAMPAFDQRIMFWNQGSNGSALEVAKRTVASTIYMGRQLLSGPTPIEATRWLPVLEWYEAQGLLDGLGADLIRDLRAQPGWSAKHPGADGGEVTAS